MTTDQVQTLRSAHVPGFTKDSVAVEIAEVETWKDGQFLVQSPYTERAHQLDLDTLNHENRLLAQAMAGFNAIREDYATASYNESFNWPETIAELKRLAAASSQPFKETTFYIVAFRSQIKPSTNYSHLGELDKAAHKEAIDSGGFLKYWFGSPDSELRNLATCIWTSREHAIAGGRGPAHRKAAISTRALYAYWKIDQHRLTIRDNVDDWEITSWTD